MSASEICLLLQLLALHYMKGKRDCFDVHERTSLHYEKSVSILNGHPASIHTSNSYSTNGLTTLDRSHTTAVSIQEQKCININANLLSVHTIPS